MPDLSPRTILPFRGIDQRKYRKLFALGSASDKFWETTQKRTLNYKKYIPKLNGHSLSSNAKTALKNNFTNQYHGLRLDNLAGILCTILGQYHDKGTTTRTKKYTEHNLCELIDSLDFSLLIQFELETKDTSLRDQFNVLLEQLSKEHPFGAISFVEYWVLTIDDTSCTNKLEVQKTKKQEDSIRAWHYPKASTLAIAGILFDLIIIVVSTFIITHQINSVTTNPNKHLVYSKTVPERRGLTNEKKLQTEDSTLYRIVVLPLEGDRSLQYTTYITRQLQEFNEMLDLNLLIEVDKSFRYPIDLNTDVFRKYLEKYSLNHLVYGNIEYRDGTKVWSINHISNTEYNYTDSLDESIWTPHIPILDKTHGTVMIEEIIAFILRNKIYEFIDNHVSDIFNFHPSTENRKGWEKTIERIDHVPPKFITDQIKILLKSLCYCAMGEYQKCLDIFPEKVEISQIELFATKCYSELQLGKCNESLESLRLIPEDYHDPSRILIFKAIYAFNCDNTNEVGYDYLNQAVQSYLDEDKSYAAAVCLELKARRYFSNRRIKDALDCINKAIKLDPKNDGLTKFKGKLLKVINEEDNH